MNIIYVGCFRLPNYDAAAPRVLNNARIMKMCGHEVRFLSWGGAYRESDRCGDGKYRIDGMEYIITDELNGSVGFLGRLKESLTRGNYSLSQIKKMAIQPDLIIMYNADRRFALKMLKYCQGVGIKLANDITEWYANNEIHVYQILPNYLNMTCVQKMVKNKIVISSSLNKYYNSSNNIILPPLCDLSESKWSAIVDDERIRPFDGITLIYAGNPARKDRVHTVINVVNKMAREGKSIRFLILGTTRESYLVRYSDVIESKELHENILFLGRVSQDLIPSYYKKADFMVLLREPTRKNMMGFPTKFAESISSGIPVIANATSDISEYIVNGKTGFIVDDEKAESLEKTLSSVLILSREQIEQMKQTTKDGKEFFYYARRKAEMDKFLNNLK